MDVVATTVCCSDMPTAPAAARIHHPVMLGHTPTEGARSAQPGAAEGLGPPIPSGHGTLPTGTAGPAPPHRSDAPCVVATPPSLSCPRRHTAPRATGPPAPHVSPPDSSQVFPQKSPQHLILSRLLFLGGPKLTQ